MQPSSNQAEPCLLAAAEEISPAEIFAGRSDPQVERILSATAALFGEPVHGPPSRYPDLRRLLATIADVHARRRGLRKPARVVYTMLRDGIPPPAPILADPLAHLPVGFLRAAGLPAPDGGDDPQNASRQDPAGWDEHLSDAYRQDRDGSSGLHPSLALPVQAEADRETSCCSAAEAWRIALQIMRGEMPRLSFEKYLSTTRLIRFELGGAGPGGCLFTIQAEDAYCRDWLAQRLSRSLCRTLSGICKGEVRVEFVTPP